MPYNRFRFKTVGEQLGLTIRYIPDFEPKPVHVDVRPALREWLKPDPRYPLVSEIARREWIISTVFRELLYHTQNDITVYSGEIFNIDHSLGLEGEVDYMVALGKDIYPVPAPVVAVAEAKPNNLSTGMGAVHRGNVRGTVVQSAGGVGYSLYVWDRYDRDFVDVFNAK